MTGCYWNKRLVSDKSSSLDVLRLCLDTDGSPDFSQTCKALKILSGSLPRDSAQKQYCDSAKDLTNCGFGIGVVLCFCFLLVTFSKESREHRHGGKLGSMHIICWQDPCVSYMAPANMFLLLNCCHGRSRCQ